MTDACRPVLSSARITKYVWQAGEMFKAELWILNDSYFYQNSGIVKAYIQIGESKLHMLTWEYLNLAQNTNVQGPTARIRLPKIKMDRFQLILEVDGQPEFNSEYTLCYRYHEEQECARPKQLND